MATRFVCTPPCGGGYGPSCTTFIGLTRFSQQLPKCPPIARILAYTLLPDRAATVRERWLTPQQACAPRPRGHPVAARIGASRPSPFMSRTPGRPSASTITPSTSATAEVRVIFSGPEWGLFSTTLPFYESLIVAESHHRIHTGRPARRQQTREKGHYGEHGDGPGKRERIGDGDFEYFTLQVMRQQETARQSRHYANDYQLGTHGQHLAQHVAALGSQRHAHSDFVGAAGHAVR